VTKREIVKLLDRFEDDQFVCVLRVPHHADMPREQLMIQDIIEFPPWHPAEDGKQLVGILVHASNKQIA